MADTSYQRFTDRKEGLKKMMICGGGIKFSICVTFPVLSFNTNNFVLHNLLCFFFSTFGKNFGTSG